MRLPLLGLSALLLLPRVASAVDVWTVGPGGEFSRITDALAVSFGGDRILVEPGTYNECVLIDGLDVRIVALEGPGATTISCATGTAAVRIINNSTAHIDGFTITHTNGGGIQATDSSVVLGSLVMSDLGGVARAGCISVVNGPASIYGVNLTRCDGTSGAAIRFDGTQALAVVGGVIDDPDATGEGGAIFFRGRGLTISGTTITNAHASLDGGGVFVNDLSGTTAHLSDIDVSGSSAQRGGGVFGLTPMYISDSTLTANHAAQGGPDGAEGGAIFSAVYVSVRRSSVTDNTSDQTGGAIAAPSGQIELAGTTFERNTAGIPGTGIGFGGAVYSTSYLSTNGTTFKDNAAYLGQGGAVFATGTWFARDDVYTGNGKVAGTTVSTHGGAAITNSADIRWSRFSGNSSTVLGGALYAGNGVDLDSVRFVDNTSGSGPSGGGGAAFIYGLGNTIANSVFTNNSAPNGGALALNSSTQIVISGSVFEDNDAIGSTGDGGAIHQIGSTSATDENVTINGTFFRANTAGRDGGALYLTRGLLNMSAGWLTHNTAGGRGGAAFLSLSNTVDTDRLVFCQNDAAGNGGGVYVDQAQTIVRLEEAAFVQNEAFRGGAVYDDVHSSSATHLLETTLLRNRATNGNEFAGAVLGPNGRLQTDFSVFQENGTHGIRSLSAAPNPTALFVFTSDFLQTTAFQADGTVSSSGNNSSPNTGNPSKPIPDAQWDPGAGCFDDDLTARWTWQGPTNGASRPSGAGTAGTGPQLYADTDGDGDGVAQRDCDPNNGAVSLDAVEIPGNDVDDDCVFGNDPDGDDDGYAPSTHGGADCADGDATFNPSAFDVPGEGGDQDCWNGDETDGDHDGTSVGSDCDDADPLLNMSRAEIPYDGPDRNCLDDEYDADDDGGDSSAFGGNDCDDFTDLFGPLAYDTPYDGVDQNCDGFSDFDADTDGFESASFGGTDCNDFDPATNPDGPEIPYDGVDQDCAGGNDYDFDEDGFVATAYNVFAGGSAPGQGDCDDFNANTFPGAPEISDDLDNTCDGVVNPDPDFDSDGVLDWWEGVFGTGVGDVDSDDDGISDGDEWGDDEQHPGDADGDGVPNALETDSDADTLLDATEGLADHDGDGLQDFRDVDDDGDAIGTIIEDDALGLAGPDTDKDGTPDWLDRDADNDGVVDLVEGTADDDGDGIGAWRDAGESGDGSEDPGDPAYGFCGCTSAPGVAWSPAWILGLVAVLGRRRRAN